MARRKATQVYICLIFLCLSSLACLNTAEPKRVVSTAFPEQPLPEIRVDWAPELEYSLRYFLKKDPKFVNLVFKRKAEYRPMLESIFLGHGLPVGLTNIAAIESKFNPKARSSYGATGMWQFMKATARAYGLTINLWTDERKDPRKSTIAAAKYLSVLYDQFDDWYWALAAYNAGPTKIRKLRRKYPSRTFWQVARSGAMPGQTKAFVSRVIAINIIEKNRVRPSELNSIQIAQLIQFLRRVYA